MGTEQAKLTSERSLRWIHALEQRSAPSVPSDCLCGKKPDVACGNALHHSKPSLTPNRTSGVRHDSFSPVAISYYERSDSGRAAKVVAWAASRLFNRVSNGLAFGSFANATGAAPPTASPRPSLCASALRVVGVSAAALWLRLCRAVFDSVLGLGNARAWIPIAVARPLHHNPLMQRFGILALVFVSVFVSACASAKGSTPDEQRAHIRKLEKETLARLFKEHPEAKAALESAPGYAVFDTSITKIPVIGAGGGYGVIVDADPVARTYMKVREFQLGAGWGARRFQVVVIFHNAKIRDDLKDGKWSFGGGAEAAAKVGESGAAGGGGTGCGGDDQPFTKYVLTEAGVSLTATVNAKRISRMGDLN